MVADAVGEQDLRATYYDTAVKAVALMEYKLKSLCTISSTGAHTNYYYRETNSELTGGAGNATAGVPRYAQFPHGDVTETLVSSVISKYAFEGEVSHEDEITDNLPMVQRTILRVGRAVSYAVDTAIAAAMLASAGNSVAIVAGSEWDSDTIANRDPIKNIADGVQTMRADNLNPLNANGYLCMNGTDYVNFATNSKILNHPTYQTVSAVENGVVGMIYGLKIMVTEALEVTTPDVCYIVIAQEAMTWKEAESLKVEQIVDPGIRRTIRAWEQGVVQVTSPNAICKITNTRK